jgi:hypothetical protein
MRLTANWSLETRAERVCPWPRLRSDRENLTGLVAKCDHIRRAD